MKQIGDACCLAQGVYFGSHHLQNGSVFWANNANIFSHQGLMVMYKQMTRGIKINYNFSIFKELLCSDTCLFHMGVPSPSRRKAQKNWSIYLIKVLYLNGGTYLSFFPVFLSLIGKREIETIRKFHTRAINTASDVDLKTVQTDIRGQSGSV